MAAQKEKKKFRKKTLNSSRLNGRLSYLKKSKKEALGNYFCLKMVSKLALQ